MSFVSPQKQESDIRRLQLETGANLDATNEKISRLESKLTLAAVGAETGAVRPLMHQQLRNSDHNHSVDSWYNSTPSGTIQAKEAANVYTFPPVSPIRVTDAAIAAADNVLHCNTSQPFTSAMVGRFVKVEGAGASGGELSASITAYTDAATVTLSALASVTVTGAAARINSLKLTHTNAKNTPGVAITDALKNADHDEYATNINDPDWVKDAGIVRLGTTNIIAYPFGYFKDDGSTYVALHQLFPGRKIFARINCARANEFVKIKGKLFFGIYNNHENYLDWVRGGNFQLSSRIIGTPPTVTTAKYMVIIETQSGFSIVSDVLTVTNAPDAASLDSRAAETRLTWTAFDGAVNVSVYRQFAGENVFLLEAGATISGNYTDVNNPARQDTGSTAFPVIADEENNIASYWASSLGEFDELAVNGTAWDAVEAFLPFPSSVNLAEVFDPHFVVGLTEPPATEVLDAVCASGNPAVTSAAGIFNAEDFNGKNYILRNPATGDTVSGTATFVSAGTLNLSVPPTWSGEGNVLEIADSQPHGFLYDLVGAANMDEAGEWTFHPDDNNRPQKAESNPNGSTVSTSGNGGGTGGIHCVLGAMKIKVLGGRGFLWRLMCRILLYFNFHGEWMRRPKIVEKRADRITTDDLIWSGFGTDAASFNSIKWIRHREVNEVVCLRASGAARELICTVSHRIVPSRDYIKCGTAIKNIAKGEKSLIFSEKKFNLETISDRRRITGRFNVVSFGLNQRKNRLNAHLIIVNDWLSHNEKALQPEY